MKQKVAKQFEKHLGEIPPLSKPKNKDFGHLAEQIFK